MDRVLRHAIAQGLPPLIAIQMATINTAEHFGVSREMGMIAPGRWADIVLVRDLANFQADLVISRGQTVADAGRLLVDLPVVTYPDWALHSVNLKHPLVPADFRLPSAVNSPVTANVIGIIENQAPTRHLRVPIEMNDGEVQADLARDLAKVALVERHRGTGEVQVGLVHGFGFSQPCAIATTVAHDSHQMIVVGTNDADMATAANHLSALGGGQVVVCQGEIIGQVDLPIAGISFLMNGPTVSPEKQVPSLKASVPVDVCSIIRTCSSVCWGLWLSPICASQTRGWWMSTISKFCLFSNRILQGCPFQIIG